MTTVHDQPFASMELEFPAASRAKIREQSEVCRVGLAGHWSSANIDLSNGSLEKYQIETDPLTIY